MTCLRLAGPDDAALVAALHCASWRSAYAGILDAAYLGGPIEAERLAAWQARFGEALPARRVIIAETGDGNAVGFVCALRDADAQHGGLIDNLHVHPDHRGGGIGAVLLRAGAAWLADGPAPRPMHLWVYEANGGGRRFYARLGGVEVERDSGDHPADGGQSVWRVVWPDAAALAAG